jgi:hypothetical protein
VKTITNNQWRDFVDSYDVPSKVLADQFEHLDLGFEHSGGGFFKYRGYWYHLSDFLATSADAPGELAKWQGFHGDSFFSGVAVRISDDGEQYQVATLLS